jgi:hypothetical protein
VWLVQNDINYTKVKLSQRQFVETYIPVSYIDAAGFFLTLIFAQTNNWLTPWNNLLLEDSIIPYLVKKFPMFNRNVWFITIFTRLTPSGSESYTGTEARPPLQDHATVSQRKETN